MRRPCLGAAATAHRNNFQGGSHARPMSSEHVLTIPQHIDQRKCTLPLFGEIWHADCIEILSTLPAGCVDAIMADLPYGTTANKWDCLLDLDRLWREFWRVCRGNAPVVLTAAQPFTSRLVMSALREFKYEWIWQKEAGTGLLNAKKQPLRDHESVLVFYRQQPLYSPQFTEGAPYRTTKGGGTDNYGASGIVTTESDGRRYPKTVQRFPRDREKVHPTQKPVALFQYLVRTYTAPNAIVLDATMGSGTTGVACIREGRRFIGIEKEPSYFDVAKKRLLDEASAFIGGEW